MIDLELQSRSYTRPGFFKFVKGVLFSFKEWGPARRRSLTIVFWKWQIDIFYGKWREGWK